MRYRIERTAKAEEQLRDIVFYRAELTLSVDPALKLLDKLDTEVMQLADFPETGAPPRYAALRGRKLRVLIVERYLLFYKVNHESKTVTIYAVVDVRREYLNLI